MTYIKSPLRLRSTHFLALFVSVMFVITVLLTFTILTAGAFLVLLVYKRIFN